MIGPAVSLLQTDGRLGGIMLWLHLDGAIPAETAVEGHALQGRSRSSRQARRPQPASHNLRQPFHG